jgi:hypothetical protein
MSAPRTFFAGLAALCLAAGSCRRVEVCGANCTDSMTPVGAGGTPSGGKRAASTSGEAATLVGGGAADAGNAGEAGAGGEPSAEPLRCDVGTADCDYSRLTGCETELSWTVRHCGACGVSCEDGCLAGKCLQSLMLRRDSEVISFASMKTDAFAALKNMDSTRTLLRVRVDTGEVSEILRSFGDDPKLALGGDRVYLFEPTQHEIRSMRFDGSDQQLEDLDSPVEMDAYSGGTYYIGGASDADENTTYPLYYRPDAASAWQVLKADAPGSLVSASNHGVVYTESDADDVEQIYVLQGDTITAYGPSPLNAEHVLATMGGVAVLTLDYDTSAVELWWLTTGSAPTHYALPATSTPRMRPYRDQVAVSLVEGKAAYVQLFNASGPDTTQIGVRLGSQLEGIDDHYLWHLVSDDWFHWRLLRTEWDLFGF